jgi:hypothetical protein
MDEHDDNSESPSIHCQVSSFGNSAEFLFQQSRLDGRIHLDLKYITVTANEMRRENSVQQYIDMRSFSTTNPSLIDVDKCIFISQYRTAP